MNKRKTGQPHRGWKSSARKSHQVAEPYKQEPPFAVQIELVEGCNLRCQFCALTGIRGKDNDLRFMTINTIRETTMQMMERGWNPRVEFAVHGEPSLHPEAYAMIAAVREIAPRYQIMMTSNGGGLLRAPGPLERIEELFEAGLNILALDDYEGVKIVPKIREQLKGAETFHQMEHPVDEDSSPHTRRNIKWRGVIYIQSIDVATQGTHSTLNNHAGVGAPPVDQSHPSQRQRCAKPFREMTVRWDGNVSVCCNDFRGYFKAGNVVTDGLDAVWNGEAMDAARRMLMHEGRAAGPCRGCDAVSHRVGLLPDKMGKATMPRPTPASRAAVARALAGSPYTAPVLRPWERPA